MDENVNGIEVVPLQNVGAVERVFFAVNSCCGGDDAVSTLNVIEYGVVAIFDGGGIQQFCLAVYNLGESELHGAGLFGGLALGIYGIGFE